MVGVALLQTRFTRQAALPTGILAAATSGRVPASGRRAGDPFARTCRLGACARPFSERDRVATLDLCGCSLTTAALAVAPFRFGFSPQLPWVYPAAIAATLSDRRVQFELVPAAVSDASLDTWPAGRFPDKARRRQPNSPSTAIVWRIRRSIRRSVGRSSLPQNETATPPPPRLAPRAADAVDVNLGHSGHVVIDDVRPVVDVSPRAATSVATNTGRLSDLNSSRTRWRAVWLLLP